MNTKAKRKSIILAVAHIALCTLCLVFASFGVGTLTAHAEEGDTKVYNLNLTMTGYEWGKNIADVTITGEEDKITIDSIQFRLGSGDVVTSGTFKARQYTVAIFITPKSGYDISECTNSTVKINSESVYLFNTSGCNAETGQRKIYAWLDELTIPDGADVPEIKSLSLEGITAPADGNTISTSATVTATALIENPDGSTETKTDALTFNGGDWTTINLFSPSETSSETEFHSGNTYLFRIRYSLNDDYIGLSADNITVNGAPEGTTVRLDSDGTILVLFPTLGSDELRLAEPEMEQIPAGYLGTWLFYEARFAGGKYPYTVEVDHSDSWINSYENNAWSGYPTGITCKGYRPTTTQPKGSITLKVTDANGTVKTFTVSVGAVTEDPNAIKEIRLNYTIPAVGASCPTEEEIKNAITLLDDLEWDTSYTPVARWVISGTGTTPTAFEKYGTYELQLRLKIKDESVKTFAGGSLLEGIIVSGDKEYKASFANWKEKSVTFFITIDAYGNNIKIVTDKIECKVGVPFTGKIVLSGVESGDEIVIDKNYGFATNLTFGTDGSITGTPTSAGTYSVEIRVWWKTVGGTLLAIKNVQVVIEDRTAIDVPVGKTLKYNGSEQTGVESGTGYTLSGTVNATDVGLYSVTVTLEPGYKWPNGSLYNQTVNWEIVKGDRVAPTGITAENASNGASDGKIKGVTMEMEYRASDISSYTACTGTEITGLKKGTYYVRFKENANYNASSDFAVTVGEDGVVTHNVAVTDGTGSGVYAVGDSVTVKANEPAKGKTFDKWTATGITLTDEQTKSTEITFTMPDANVTLTATYKDIIYTVTVTDGTADKTSVTYGESVTVEASAPAKGKTFDKWTATGVTLANPTSSTVTFNMPDCDVVLTATYKDIIYTVTVTDGTADKTSVTYGESVTVEASAPAKGKTFDKWTATGITLTDEQTKSTEITFTMPDCDVVLTATYKELSKYHVTVFGGTGAGDYYESDSVTVKADTAGKTFVNWTATGITLSDEDAKRAEITFIMPDGDVTLTANFKKDSVSVTVSGGTGAGDYNVGDSVTVTANVPEEGKEFDGWYVNGVKVSSDASYTFIAAESIALEARYKNAGAGDDQPGGEQPEVEQPEKTGLSGGAIAGIIVGSVAVAGLGGLSIFWFVIKKKKFADLIALFKK